MTSSTETPKYAWVVTRDGDMSDTSSTVGKLGPEGAARRFRVNQVLLTGRAFQMKGPHGRVMYSGYLTGEAKGVEPLVDYGYDHGCSTIEFDHDGTWVPLSPTSD